MNNFLVDCAIYKILGGNDTYPILSNHQIAVNFQNNTLTADDIRQYILTNFLNQWRSRIPNRKLQLIANNLIDILPANTLQNENLLTSNLDSLRNDIILIYNQLTLIDGIGPTSASKLLSLIQPDLFVMWDGAIRWNLSFRPNASGYFSFLKSMQNEAIRLQQEYENNNRLNSDFQYLNEYVSNRMEYPNVLSIAKYLDEVNWTHITRRINVYIDTIALQINIPHHINSRGVQQRINTFFPDYQII